MTSGVLYTGDVDGSTFLTKAYDLSEIPVFARAGAVVPSIPGACNNCEVWMHALTLQQWSRAPPRAWHSNSTLRCS